MNADWIHFFTYWGCISLSMWLASGWFSGLHFQNKLALIASSLLLGLMHSTVRPYLIFISFPFIVLSFGLFFLFINAAILWLVALCIPGFTIRDFKTTFWVSVFISVLSSILHWMLPESHVMILPVSGSVVHA